MKVKMTMHEEPLLSYRIREKSTTGQRRFLQALTLNYVRQICRKDPNRSGSSPILIIRPTCAARDMTVPGPPDGSKKRRIFWRTPAVILPGNAGSAWEKPRHYPAFTAEIFCIKFKQRG